MPSVRPGAGRHVGHCFELANGLILPKKDECNKKTYHLILKMSMKKAFIWVSGLSFIDKKMARNFFGFLAKNKPVQWFRKTNNIPGANWLKPLKVRVYNTT